MPELFDSCFLLPKSYNLIHRQWLDGALRSLHYYPNVVQKIKLHKLWERHQTKSLVSLRAIWVALDRCQSITQDLVLVEPSWGAKCVNILFNLQPGLTLRSVIVTSHLDYSNKICLWQSQLNENNDLINSIKNLSLLLIGSCCIIT